MSSVNKYLEAINQANRTGSRFVHSASNSVRVGMWTVKESQASNSERVLPAPTLKKQVQIVFTEHFRSVNRFPSQRAMTRRCEGIVTAFYELNANGFAIRDVTTFSLRHAKALLEAWKKKGLKRSTIYCRWSALRTWSNALGKTTMLGRVEDYWPEFKRSDAPKQMYHILTPEQLEQRSDFLHRQRDKTCYLVDRLTRELHMTRELALEIEFGAIETVIQGAASLRVGVGGRSKTFVQMASHAALMQELHQFMAERRRNTLAWTGRDLDQAISKYAARMSYVTKQLFCKKNGGAA